MRLPSWRAGMPLLFFFPLIHVGCEPDAAGVAVPLPAEAGPGCIDFKTRYRLFVSFKPPVPSSPIADAGSDDAASSDAGNGAVDAGDDAGKFIPPSQPPVEKQRPHVRVQLKLGLRDGVTDMSLTTVDVRASSAGSAVTLLRARASDRVLDLDLDAISDSSFNLVLENAFPCNGRTQSVNLTITLNDDGSSRATTRIADQKDAVVPTQDTF